MTLTLVFLALAGAALVIAVVVVRAGEYARLRSSLAAYDLVFPYGLRPESVSAFLAGLTGLVSTHWLRAVAMRCIIFETVATRAGITHRILVPQTQAEAVLAALRAICPVCG